MGPETVLFSEMVPQEAWESDFNEWYNSEHVPDRLAIAGFIRANRYLSTTDPRHYLAVYEIAGKDVLAQPTYQKLKGEPSERTAWMLSHVSGFTRYTGALRGMSTRPDAHQCWEAPYLYPVFFTVPVAREPEFNAWYERDHVPTLLAEPAWLGCRRYKVSGEPEGYTHLALHYLESPDALKSPFRTLARNSPWRKALTQEDWFKGAYHVFKRLEPVWEA